MEANWLYTSDDTSVSFNDMSVIRIFQLTALS
jgi:hypothetical protein